MKRSKFVATWLATVAISPLGLVMQGCSEPEAKTAPPPPVYKSLADCKDKEANDALCEQAFNQAREDQLKQAKNSKAECEAEYGTGNCETRRSSDGGSDVFVPMMMGYMMGNMLAGGGGSSYDYDRDRRGSGYRGPYGGSVYYGRGGGAVVRDPSGASRSYPSYQSFQSSRTAPSVSSKGAVSRGGFGATASARGGTAGG